jgi:hypothetical protein
MKIIKINGKKYELSGVNSQTSQPLKSWNSWTKFNQEV